MNTKLLAILSAVIITLLTSSYAYACINNPPNHLNNLNIEFMQVNTSDNENLQDIAKIYAQISYDRYSVYVQIWNAYPTYEGELKYVIKNTGNKPVEFAAPTIINQHPEAIEITTTSHENQILQPCQTLQGTLTILILQDAKQNTQYTFQVKNTATVYKQPVNPQTPNYWRQQIQTCLNNPNQAQIEPATLQTYLTQISQQSNVFNFQGSQNQILQQALNILNPTKQNSQTTLNQQLLALWLNQQADLTDGLKIDDKTAEQIIQASENALLTHQTNRYSTYANKCEEFNNL